MCLEGEIGAVNGARTRGLDHGKVALYQLSYYRKSKKVVGDQGVEPRMSKTPGLQSGAVASAAHHLRERGAGDGIRTRDLNVGNVELYH